MRRASVGFPTFAFRERHEQKQYIAAPNGPRRPGLGLGRPPSWKEIGKKEEPHPCLPLCFGGKRIEGNLSCLTCLFGRNPRPSPQCLRLLPLLGKLHPTRSWLNRSPLAANQRCRLCSPGIGPTSTAGFFGSSAMRRLPRTS